jgi:hypothetical protein
LVLYSKDHVNDASKVLIDYVNEGLRRGHLVVYIPFKTRDDYNNKANYEDHNNNNNNHGTLLTLGAETFYQSALEGNLEPFEELRVLLEEANEERMDPTSNNNNTTTAFSEISSLRNSDEDAVADASGITIIGAIAGKLAQDRKFEESIELEKWCQKTHSDLVKKGLKVNIICLHPSPRFSSEDQFTHRHTQTISMLHDTIIEHNS